MSNNRQVLPLLDPYWPSERREGCLSGLLWNDSRNWFYNGQHIHTGPVLEQTKERAQTENTLYRLGRRFDTVDHAIEAGVVERVYGSLEPGMNFDPKSE